MTFRLAALSEGNSPLYWDDIQTILGEADVPIIPDAAYQPYTEVITLGNGQKRGMGLPSATWLLSLTPTQKYILRQFCLLTSAAVYIETTTNNFDVSGNQEWIQASAIMEWQEGEENIDADITLDLTIRFSHLVEVT